MDPKLRLAHEWLWQNCDCAGVWEMDADMFRFEVGYKLDVHGLLTACPWVQQLSSGALFFTEFIRVNYGVLKDGYNPHKPVFRSLVANGIEPLTLSESARPFVTPVFGVKRSGSTRKKLRQDWNRLSALGTVDVVNDRTLDGALQLSGQGEWLGQRLRFKGVASAAPERVEALSNLLNIVGRRDGARSIITVG